MQVAIIPARGGSKRIAKKNIRLFAGKPIIAYSIEAAFQSGLFERVIVSTDDPEIARVAMKYGAEIPFIRPAELSGDHVATIPVIRHAIDWFHRREISVTHACCLYAASPFIRVQDLKQGHANLMADHVEFSFPVATFPAPIFRALKIEQQNAGMFWPEHELTRSQDLPEAYFDAGQFYWGTSAAFQRHDGFFGASSAPVIVPRHLAQDIDTPEDWTNAEIIFQMLQEQERASSQTQTPILRKFAA